MSETQSQASVRKHYAATRRISKQYPAIGESIAAVRSATKGGAFYIEWYDERERGTRGTDAQWPRAGRARDLVTSAQALKQQHPLRGWRIMREGGTRAVIVI